MGERAEAIGDAEHVTFIAAFPSRGQVIKYDADGGARIILDIPASDEDAIEQLRHYRGCALMVTVVPMDSAVLNTAEQGDGEEQHELAARTKRQSRWQTA